MPPPTTASEWVPACAGMTKKERGVDNEAVIAGHLLLRTLAYRAAAQRLSGQRYDDRSEPPAWAGRRRFLDAEGAIRGIDGFMLRCTIATVLRAPQKNLPENIFNGLCIVTTLRQPISIDEREGGGAHQGRRQMLPRSPFEPARRSPGAGHVIIGQPAL